MSERRPTRNVSRQTTVERQPDGRYDVVVRYLSGSPLRYEGERVITDQGVLSEHRPYRAVGPKQARRLAEALQPLLDAAWHSGIDHERHYHDRYNGCPNR
jgi:hypothetical protein